MNKHLKLYLIADAFNNMYKYMIIRNNDFFQDYFK